MAGALAFQYIGNLPPCAMCIWQRWPHVIAIGLGLAFWIVPAPLVLLLGGFAALVTAGIGAYHVGVEQGVFAGPDTCTSGPIGTQSAEDLLNSILEAPLVRCDEIAWALAGISMAGWNAIFSLVLAVIWIGAYQRARVN